MTFRKVMRPKGWDPKKMKHFPVWSQPKIDGCRGYNPEGLFMARTQKVYKNRFITAQFSGKLYMGFDGEIAAERETHPDLVRITSSAINSYDGSPFVLWHIFDYVTDDNHALPYRDRYAQMVERINMLQRQGLCGHLRVVPYVECNSVEEVLAAHERWMREGYEGSCVWDPAIPHKEGDSSPTHRGCVRIKDFVDVEGLILGITEGETNNNEAQINELGRTFRTSHQDNKAPNGMIGSIQLRALADLYDPYDKKKLLVAKDQEFDAAPGALSHQERVHYFQHPDKFIGGIGKVKFFPKGMKDKPRFPQFDSLRAPEDL